MVDAKLIRGCETHSKCFGFISKWMQIPINICLGFEHVSGSFNELCPLMHATGVCFLPKHDFNLLRFWSISQACLPQENQNRDFWAKLGGGAPFFLGRERNLCYLEIRFAGALFASTHVPVSSEQLQGPL